MFSLEGRIKEKMFATPLSESFLFVCAVCLFCFVLFCFVFVWFGLFCFFVCLCCLFSLALVWFGLFCFFVCLV